MTSSGAGKAALLGRAPLAPRHTCCGLTLLQPLGADPPPPGGGLPARERRLSAEAQGEARGAVVAGAVVVVVVPGERDVDEGEPRLGDEVLDAREAAAVVGELRRELEEGPAVRREELGDGVEERGERLPLVPGQEKGDSTSLQRGRSARARSKERRSRSRPFREMITRPKISQNEWKTTEI